MITATANGGECTIVSVGESVRFSVVIEVPPGAGIIVAAEWDFEGSGDFPVNENLDAPRTHMALKENLCLL